jgi:hypothetical protein
MMNMDVLHAILPYLKVAEVLVVASICAIELLV